MSLLARRQSSKCRVMTFVFQQLEVGAALSRFIAPNTVFRLLGKNPNLIHNSAAKSISPSPAKSACRPAFQHADAD